MSPAEKKLRRQIKGWPEHMQTMFLFLFQYTMSADLQMTAYCDAYAQSLRDVADAVERDYGSKAK